MPDDQYYYDLAYARGQQQEQREIQDTANRVIKPPSGTLYFFLYCLAGIGDILDWLTLTGIGAIVSFIVDLFIGIILFFAGRAARDRIKTMNEFQDGLHGHIQNIERKIVAYRNAYAKILRVSRKVKILRKPVRKLALRFARLRKSVARSPLGRTIAAIIADLIPFLDLMPWRTINIYMMKKQEMQAFQDAQNMLPEYMEAKADEIEAANDLQEAEMTEQAA
ncbi:MAG: hypothetical protein HYX20_03955 [Candidatus Yanofskybacteria bacterium]|nr:hypothetical protein [Candidatus Yanofskybacteria bacterium]